MYNRVTDIVLLPYEGSPFGMHIKYHYGDKPNSTASSTPPHSAVTIPTSTLQRTHPAWSTGNKSIALRNQRMRAVFTSEQLTTMENEFHRNSFVSRARRAEIAWRIGVEERQVRDWFQNRRVRAKRYQEFLNHSEVDLAENQVADCAEELTDNREIRDLFCGTQNESYKKDNAIKDIVNFLEGCRDGEMRTSTPLCHDRETSCIQKMLSRPPLQQAAPEAELIEQTISNTDDLEDALNVLKKEVKETSAAHTSLKSQLKRKIIDDDQGAQPPPPKKNKADVVENILFYHKQCD